MFCEWNKKHSRLQPYLWPCQSFPYSGAWDSVQNSLAAHPGGLPLGKEEPAWEECQNPSPLSEQNRPTLDTTGALAVGTGVRMSVFSGPCFPRIETPGMMNRGASRFLRRLLGGLLSTAAWEQEGALP